MLGNETLIVLWVSLHCSHSRENRLLGEVAHAELHVLPLNRSQDGAFSGVSAPACGRVCHLQEN